MIAMITERQFIAKTPHGDNIYLIKDVDFVPFNKSIFTYTDLPKEIVVYIDGIKKILTEQGFYFSYHADLTSSQQRQSTVKFEYNPGVKNDFKFRD